MSAQMQVASKWRDFDCMEEIDAHMSNFDGEIDKDMDGQLRAQPGRVYSHHAAYNFNGKVWFEAGQFHSEIWVYGSPRQTFHAESLRELMDIANGEYGSD